MKRVTFKLSSDERYRLRRLKPLPGQAFKFWETVAETRGIDPASIMWIDGEYSGLPVGHKHHWCYPVPLVCKVDPSTVEI